MKVWVTVMESCSDCNTFGVFVTSEKPSDKKLMEFKSGLGGMWCIHEHVLELEVDGESIEGDQKEYR